MNDLFEDFDLKSDAPQEKKYPETTEDTVKEKIEDAPAEIDSAEAHPDIFSEPADETTEDAAAAENDDLDAEADDMSAELSGDEIRNLESMIEQEQKSTSVTFSFKDEKKPEMEQNVSSAETFVVPDNDFIPSCIDKISRPNVVIDPDNFGSTLKKLREASGISIDDLSFELKIKKDFLVALEEEDFENLPPDVYIVAYIRRLGGVYHLTDDEIIALSGKVRDRMVMDYPEDMEKVVSIYEHSEENDEKLRKFAVVFISILVIIVIAVAGILVYGYVNRKQDGVATPEQAPESVEIKHFQKDSLIDLQPEVRLNKPLLKMEQ